MTFHDRDGLRYFTFSSLDQAGAPHAIFTRLGGVSQHPFASLNFGYSVGDERHAAEENRRRAYACIGRNPSSSPDIYQVHSDRIIPARLRNAHEPLPEADGWVTDSGEFTLSLRFADCVPILLYDPVRRVAGIAHAGWKGTASQIAARAVEAMQRLHGSRPADILAGIGPSIGPDHYLVGDDVAQTMRAAYGAAAEKFLARHADGSHLDLWSANETALRTAGVEQIEIAALCTACHTEDWFSHRAEHGRTGRFGAMIWISPALK
jgi:polyphenol oxidase